MSANKLTPGLHRIEKNVPKQEYGLATKVTGRNVAAVTHIMSLEAERTREPRGIGVAFGSDGSLLEVSLFEMNEDGTVKEQTLFPGDYLVLESDQPEAEILDAESYRELFRPVS